MMMPYQTELLTHRPDATPTEHERTALSLVRRARRASLLRLVARLFSASRHPALPPRAVLKPVR